MDSIKRPILITVLAGLYFLAGIVTVLSQWQILLEPSQAQDAMHAFGTTIPLYIFQTGFVSVLMVVCGVGLLLKKSWSWWLAMFLEGNAIVFSIYTLVLVASVAPLLLMVKKLIPLGVAIFFFIYLVNKNVVVHYEVKIPVTSKLFGVVFGANIGLVSILGLVRV